MVSYQVELAAGGVSDGTVVVLGAVVAAAGAAGGVES